MKDSMTDFFKAAYGNDSACVIIADMSGNIIWKNDRTPPFDPASLNEVIQLPESGSIESGDYFYFRNGIMYDYHLTNASDMYYIISCSKTPSYKRLLSNPEICKTVENFLARSRTESLSITAAAAQLNDFFEDFTDDHVPPELLNEQTNIIMHSCSRKMKNQYLCEEIMRYIRNEETEKECISCGLVINTFAENAELIIGPRGSTIIKADEVHDVFINASAKRFEYFLLCLFVSIRRKRKGTFTLKISAKNTGTESVIIFRLTQTGDEEVLSPFLSRFIPPNNDTAELSMEDMIINSFLNEYGGSIITSEEDGSEIFSVRLPAANPQHITFCISRKKSIFHNLISPYHAVLWEISDFRYF